MWKVMSFLLIIGMGSGFSQFIFAQDEGIVGPEEGGEAVTAEEGVEGEAEEGEEGAEGEGKTKKNIYIPIKPAFVVNYGGAGKLKYIKADISIRLSNSHAAHSVRHHMPYIRNNLVMLFSSQTDESISSQEGKEALRLEALQEVKDVLFAEDRQDGVTDLYFNNFLIQK